MAIKAELSDGRVLEFPDGTDPSVIQATVKRILASSAQPAVAPAATSAPAPTPEPVAEQPASRGFELPPVMDPFGINKPTGPAVAAPESAARVRTARDQEFAPGSELATGVKAGAKGLANLPAILGLQQDSEIAGFRQKELAAFAALDAGKEITPAEASKMGVDYARIQQYQRAAPEKRQEFKAFNQAQVDKATVGVQEGLKLYAQFTKEMQQYQGRTPDATDIETATDFANWLSFNVGSGAVQLAPVILASYYRRSGGIYGWHGFGRARNTAKSFEVCHR